jgi:hypothetical protein
MDEYLQDLENELKRLTPRRPSAGLVAALERELGPVPVVAPAPRYSSATNLRSWKWASWSLSGMAAAIAVVAIVLFNRQAASPTLATPVVVTTTQPEASQPVQVPLNRYEPVHASSVLYDMKEDGATTLPDQTEGRQVRYRYVDTYTWKNPATNASLRWSVPRDEVRLVRASLD